MFYIAETDNALQILKCFNYEGGFVEFIPTDDRLHPRLTSTVAVYLRPLNHDHGFIIPVNHEEGISVEKEYILHVLSSYDNLYTFNRKTVLYHGNLQNLIDISMIYSMTKFSKLEVADKIYSLQPFYRKYENYTNVNQIIPLSKHFERCESLYEALYPVIKYKIPKGFEYYNKLSTNLFYLLEAEGIGINEEQAVKILDIKHPNFNIKDKTIYNSYNLYNPTSRPSNSFNGINFLALPKGTEHRKCFKPKNDYFVEFDFDGYHIRLIAEQLKYELSTESAHKQLAKLYLGKEKLTEEEYSKSKHLNFQAIYGHIPDYLLKFEFFKQLDEFIKSKWEEFQEKGRIEDPRTGKELTAELGDTNSQKLLNYYVQSLETSRNLLVLKKLLSYLRDKKSKVVLYVYDSVILDFSKEDGEKSLSKIEEILSENNKFPVSFKFSNNLHF